MDFSRKDYKGGNLDISECPENPLLLLTDWINHAVSSGISDPNAMVLSTVKNDSSPSSRIVLLKGFDQNGLRFYTNYDSNKGKEIENNPKAAMLFFWSELEQQIRIEGVVYKLDPETSDAYFSSRPLDSQINASISPQSKVIPGREYLIDKRDQLKSRIKTGQEDTLARPDFWGGYVLKPHSFEFWQGGPGRLNDRILYTYKNKTWQKSILAP